MIYGNNQPNYSYLMPQQQPQQQYSRQMYSTVQPQMSQMSQAQQSYNYSNTPQPQIGIDYIQGGVNSAKAYPKPAPGSCMILMDAEENIFYTKKTDPSGIPIPLRAFGYTEIPLNQENQYSQNSGQDMSQYMKKEDFEKMLEKYLGPLNNKGEK